MGQTCEVVQAVFCLLPLYRQFLHDWVCLLYQVPWRNKLKKEGAGCNACTTQLPLDGYGESERSQSHVCRLHCMTEHLQRLSVHSHRSRNMAHFHSMSHSNSKWKTTSTGWLTLVISNHLWRCGGTVYRGELLMQFQRHAGNSGIVYRVFNAVLKAW